MRTDPETLWGRWGKDNFERLWKKVKEERGYTKELTGLVDYGIMFILIVIGILWILSSAWIVVTPGLESLTEVQYTMSTICLVSLEIAYGTLWRSARSETKKRKRLSTSLAKQVEALVREAVVQELENPALVIYRKNVEPILDDFEKQLQKLQEQLRGPEQ